MEKTVVPEREDARAGDRVTKALSKEVGNTDEAMSIEDPQADLTRFCDDVAEVAPLLLRSLVAEQ